MKEKEQPIDRIFREGFRDEEKFSPEIPLSRFDDFFPEEAELSSGNRFHRIFRFSAAAVVFMALAGFSWMYVQNLSKQVPEAASLAVEKTQPILLSQAAPVLPHQPAAAAEKKSSAAASKPEKPKPGLKKQPPVKKGRRKRIGATLFPGIFPAPLFASAASEKENTSSPAAQPEPDTLMQIALVNTGEQTPDILKKTDEQPELASEIESIEFRPAGFELTKEEFRVEEKAGIKKSLRALLSGEARLDLSALPSVDEAKGLLFSGIGRLIGLKNEEPETEIEKNESSEL